MIRQKNTNQSRLPITYHNLSGGKNPVSVRKYAPEERDQFLICPKKRAGSHPGQTLFSIYPIRLSDALYGVRQPFFRPDTCRTQAHLPAARTYRCRDVNPREENEYSPLKKEESDEHIVSIDFPKKTAAIAGC